jgi:ketosteroid isomerase-like protein
LAHIGLRVDQFYDEVFVTPEAAASPAHRARFDAIFGTAGDDAAEALAVVEQFHAALATGDSAGAMALLAPDAVVLEAGGTETRPEYAAHHLAADTEFARAVASRRTPLTVSVEGDVAWVAQASESAGTFRGRDIDSAGAELMVLTRSADGWRIRAFHWSSRSGR